jgi:hypothetical protein
VLRSTDTGVWLAEREKDMRRVRRKRILQRLVIGLAVAAIVAPAAQARPDGAAATQGKAAEPAAVTRGDDKVIVTGGDGPGALIHGDDKVIVTGGDGSGALIHGDDKVIVPRGGASTTLIHGDDKVIVPRPGDYTLAGYRRALPEDYGVRAVAPVEAVRGPGSFDWGDALIGAGAAFGLMLLLGGAALGTRHVRPTTA